MSFLSTSISSKLKKINDELNSQIYSLLKCKNSNIELRWIHILELLNNNEKLSVLDLANRLMLSHPAVVQFIRQLVESGYVETAKNETDKRVTFCRLTKKGREEFSEVRNLFELIDSSLNSLISKSNYDIMDVLNKVQNTISSNQLSEDVKSSLKEMQLKEVSIISYDKKYREKFKQLNIEWLQKYFTIELTDELMLNSPEKEIIKKGGEIFFAILNEDIVGTCAMLRIDKSTYELAKMAVTEKARGRQVGKKLCLTALGFAVSKKAKKVVLDTSPKLIEATNLYRQFGFIVVPHDYDDRYKRELIRMELNLEGI